MRRTLTISLARGAMLAGVLGAMLAGMPAHAQIESREGILLQNQMLDLRRDVQGLRDQINRMGSGSSLLGTPSRGSAPSGGGEMTTALLERVTQLEELVRRLQGRLDEMDNDRRRQAAELRKDIDDINFKLGNAPTGGAASRPLASGAAPATPLAPPSSPGAAPRRTPELAMQEGNAALARRDYATAEAAAREVLAFPRSPRAVDAQFLLAQALNGRRDYQGAAVAFDDTYNRSKTGARAQDSLLGLANALNAIGEKRAACATLDKLRVEFPAPRQDLREPIAGARQRAGCR